MKKHLGGACSKAAGQNNTIPNASALTTRSEISRKLYSTKPARTNIQILASICLCCAMAQSFYSAFSW